jgi:hypothetical protein
MGICSWCGESFPRTRVTRKYCTSRCRTNACLGRKPRRVRAADVEALHAMLDAHFDSVEALRASLQAILRPDMPPPPLIDGRPFVPRLD